MMKIEMNNKKQAGFTLVEIAIVLVIIGLLLGGILKGQELINSARVRNLADQNSAIQAAYFGFIDRYRQVPGDWCPTTGAACPNSATAALGVTVNIGGNGNGRIDNNYVEGAAVWEQLGRAGFLGGGFTPATAAPTTDVLYSGNAPSNAFAGALVLTRNVGFSGVAAARLNLHLGTNVPVKIARELDVKVDDGLPNSGILRVTKVDGTDTDFDVLYLDTWDVCTATAASVPGTVVAGDGDDITDIYNIFEDAQDCGQVFLY
ncbi:MAG: type II secretion system protein [Gammaproteobacteria bacterium]|nr:MAG: type II secretion system protein [Gammaproteobacteria bacterium]RKZ71751.1 MAG: type II secretion system protein [Gammaproteobacteria bacterium]